jgi:hypothetical protein
MKATQKIHDPFTIMLNKKYPEIDINRALNIFEKQHKTVEHPKLSEALKSDLNKHFLVAILDEYNFPQKD